MIPAEKQQIKVDLSNSKDVVCTNCGDRYFTLAKCLKFVSRIVSPTGQDLLVPMDVLICNRCGTELNPELAVKKLVESAETVENISDNPNISELS